MPIPLSVSHTDLMEAIKPLCELLGTSPRNFFAEPGLTIGADEVRFVVPLYHEGPRSAAVKRPGYGLESRAIGCPAAEPPGDYVHPQGLAGQVPVAVGIDEERAEWGLEIAVAIEKPWEATA